MERARALGLPLLQKQSGSSARGKATAKVHCKQGPFPEYWDEGQAGWNFTASVLWHPKDDVAA